ncbi:hypothetical protein FRC03_011783 [Tulasnella sp. 419]|nr:hypothetical protein FRC03_011783 [Tulasnella sp. 419]
MLCGYHSIMGDHKHLLFAINHVFLPPQLPQAVDLNPQSEHTLCQHILTAAYEFGDALSHDEKYIWSRIPKLIEQFTDAHQGLKLSEKDILHFTKAAQSGDVLAFLIRAQNAGLVIRKEIDSVIFESFEVSATNAAVIGAKGRLRRSFPDPAIQIPLHVFEDPNFQNELARFLAAMHVDVLGSAPVTVKAGNKNVEIRDTPHPRYITQLLTEILRGMGDAAEVPRIKKRIADDVLWLDTLLPWRRSQAWLVLRVALQTTLFRHDSDHRMYKAFITFVHAKILELGLQSELPSHLLDCMRKKTARRLAKLGSAAPSFLLQFVDKVLAQSQTLLQRRWLEAQAAHETRLSSNWNPATLNFENDTALTLYNSKEYLTRALQGHHGQQSSSSFNPNHPHRLFGVDNFAKSSIDHLTNLINSEDNFIALADFERAVWKDLEAWTTQNLVSSEGCDTIATCIERYREAASKAYASNPELLSIMILTLFRLWVGLDKMAVAQCSLLADFSPEIPSTLLHPLLLRTSESMETLDFVERYIENRRLHAIPGQSVFSSSAGSTSFGVQYFDRNLSVQNLKTRIDQAASQERARKLDELREKKARYNDLRRSADRLSCEYVWRHTRSGYRQVHSWYCEKCSLSDQASQMTIDVHEWPLPQGLYEAKTVVFELLPPPPFTIWRKITYMLLRDVCIPRNQISSSGSHMHLYSYSALASYHSQNDRDSRIVFASSTKSFAQSHYSHQNVSYATEDAICVNHGLKWSLYDSSRNEWVPSTITNCTINDHCTLQLPSGKYHNLQYVVSGTSHTSNEVMANQSDCSQELSLHEFIAFTRIRSGPRLQWLNIISELRSDSLSFREEAVYVLLRQAIWQIGPSTREGSREWHIEPTEKDFGEVLLSELRDLFVRLSANWLNAVGMRFITASVSRLLASATDQTIIEKGFKLLQDVRNATYGWLVELVLKLREIEDESRMQEFKLQICEVAATCRSTYDIDIEKAPALLCTTEDVSTFVHCAILVYYNSPPSISGADIPLRHLLQRDRRLAHIMEPLLSRQIGQHVDGLDQSIRRMWEFYRPSLNWAHLPSPNSRWVTTKTLPECDQGSQAVQLNILSGQLLVDGKPLGRLPHDIVTHPTYRRIFGQRILDVIPANTEGMDYKTRWPVGAIDDPSYRYQVFFTLRHNGSQDQLVIRTKKDNETLELIPHTVFNGDLPALLVNAQTHWLNISTSMGEIESTGTMIGLTSQLVLRAKDSQEPVLQQVVIPYSSDCDFPGSTTRCHSNFAVSTPHQPSLRYLKYTVNPTLGRLEGDGSMLSRLYQVYIHAITSNCLPDPLTECTGSEEALRELGSARMLSLQKLGEDERRILRRISQLTPARAFYPPNLQVMQTVRWSSNAISPLSQHNDFEVLARSIIDYAETLGMFDNSNDGSKSGDSHGDSQKTSEYLRDRAAHRCAIYYRSQITGPGSSSADHDIVYDSRGSSIYMEPKDEGVVFGISSTIFHWESKLSTDRDLYGTLEDCQRISGVNPNFSLAYRSDWLKQDVADFFLSACNACRMASQGQEQYQMVFSLSAWAYEYAAIRTLIPTIIAFATVPLLRTSAPPPWPSYDLSAGLTPNRAQVSEIVQNCAQEPEDMFALSSQRRITIFNQRRSSEASELTDILMRQWPCRAPVITERRDWVFDISRLEKESAPAFQTWFQNKELREYVQDIQRTLDEVYRSAPMQLSTYAFASNNDQTASVSNQHLLPQLFTVRDAPCVPSPATSLKDSLQGHQGFSIDSLVSSRAASGKCNTPSLDDLQALLIELRSNTFLQSGDPAAIQLQYADDLERSFQSLKKEIGAADNRYESSKSQMLDVVRGWYISCGERLQAAREIIQASLSPRSLAEKTIFSAGLWPSLTPRSILGVLGLVAYDPLPGPWRRALNSYARTLLTYQHACRLLNYLRKNSFEEFTKELESTVIEAEVDEEEYSIRLLIQIDGDFLARSIQIDFTKEMASPSSRNNTVLQLNMGEGKTSVIAPLVAASLSDGNALVRVVVLKPLAPSMFQLLVHRLGGLANRRVFYMPFSRTPQLKIEQVEQVQNLFTECVKKRGILLVQPEHILSFKLMGLDRKFNPRVLDSSESLVANRLLDSQRWLDKNSRDILDESDEILHVKYQLVYTIGQQQPLDGSPDRWSIAQQILTLVRKHAEEVHRLHPGRIEVQDDNSGRYPRVRILQDEAGVELVRLIAEDVAGGALDQCSFNLFQPNLRSLALDYITTLDLTSQDIRPLEDHCKSSAIWSIILILRGLLAHGILQFVLKEKRWRVDYGLDPSRTMLAVPYRAKDVPSLRAEFSHPDVTILLTCLSYYWQGLSQTQLEQCFSILFKLDNPSLQYDKWVRHTGSIRDNLKHLGGINIHDPDQRNELYGLFRYNQAVIDFFLSNVVFPRDAKEFPQKMATSGWDLAERKDHVTTGFSGTNDGRYLLPTSIEQADPLFQSSTNAKVLGYLLQPENDYYRPMDPMAKLNAEQSFLHLLGEQKPEIRVLLDVGAQILKLSNEEVASEWLDSNSNPDVQAVVFFNSDDEIFVRARNGMVEAFVSSPFRQQLDKCLLYLDDAHTRGTDFKLPLGTRAAVTLGPKVTKDRLIQGCMRMRKLGHGHSVMFFAPPEVDHSIRTVCSLGSDSDIHTKHILLWAMLESCTEVVHRISQWAQQGIDHSNRERTKIQFNASPDAYAGILQSTWMQKEARTLDEMFASPQLSTMAGQSHSLKEHPTILERYLKWAPSTSIDARVQEEQEREVILEVETERQVERPPKAIPATHRVHEDLRTLVHTGVFRSDSSAFTPLFKPLTGSPFEDNGWASQHLYCTHDFSITTQSVHSTSSDYLRPIHWVISAAQTTGTIYIVLSPHEVNELLPDIRRSDKVHLHHYSPRVTKAMKSFEDLALHCIPPLPLSWTGPDLGVITRLNLWAGQLYLQDQRVYRYLCNFLGLYSWQPSEEDLIQPDGFIKPEHRRASLISDCSFERSPVHYLKQLLSSRRKGMDFFSTHMGKVLRGRLLIDEDFHSA